MLKLLRVIGACVVTRLPQLSDLTFKVNQMGLNQLPIVTRIGFYATFGKNGFSFMILEVERNEVLIDEVDDWFV